MQNKKQVVLHFRPDKKPFHMERGLVKDGQQVGQAMKVAVAPPAQWIPNLYVAYVVKEIENGKYNGKFRFTSPDDSEAEQIEVRHLNTCPSLDKQWQIDNKRVPTTDEELVGWRFRSGEQQIFEVTAQNKQWIEFMLNHEANGTNPNRDKDTPSLFIEVDPAKELDTKKRELEKKEKQLAKEKKAIEEEIASMAKA